METSSEQETFQINGDIYTYNTLRVFAEKVLPERETMGQAWWGSGVKRIVDIALTGFITVPSFPFIGLGAAAVVLSEGFPALYQAQRPRPLIGREENDPALLNVKYTKLRTMKNGAENSEPSEVWSLSEGEDERITPIGRFLRKTSIDELPQALNILFNQYPGRLNLIGPRARSKREFLDFIWGNRAKDPYRSYLYHLRNGMQYGVLGLEVIAGRRIPVPVAAFLGKMYGERASFIGDLNIYFRSAFKILSRQGAY